MSVNKVDSPGSIGMTQSEQINTLGIRDSP